MGAGGEGGGWKRDRGRGEEIGKCVCAYVCMCVCYGRDRVDGGDAGVCQCLLSLSTCIFPSLFLHLPSLRLFHSPSPSSDLPLFALLSHGDCVCDDGSLV